MLAEPNRVCHMCLLRDDDTQTALHQIVSDYIDSLPADMRCNAIVYEQRLTVCRNCEQLRNGTCRLCGCYVEARAAKRKMGCPQTPPHW